MNVYFNAISEGNAVGTLDEVSLVQASTDAVVQDGEAIVQYPLFTEWLDQVDTLDPQHDGASAMPFEPESIPAMLELMPMGSLSDVDPQQWMSAMIGQHATELNAVERVERTFNQAVLGEPARGMHSGWIRLSDKAPSDSDAPVLRYSVDDSSSFDDSVEARKNVLEGGGRESTNKAIERLPIDVRATQSPVVQVQVQVQDDVKPQWRKPPEAALSPSGGIANAPTSTGHVLERQVMLIGPEAKWGEQMLAALRDTVQVQVQQRFQHAFIRLDPQELGSLEISVSHESGRLSVQISAAQSDVVRLLQHGSERLRQELGEHNALEVDVQVSGEKQRQGDGQRRDQAFGKPGSSAIAAQAESEKTSSDRARGSDVLVTV